MIGFWPSTDVIDAANLAQIVSNSGQDEVIMRSMRYQTLRTDKNSARNYSTMKLKLLSNLKFEIQIT